MVFGMGHSFSNRSWFFSWVLSVKVDLGFMKIGHGFRILVMDFSVNLVGYVGGGK